MRQIIILSLLDQPLPYSIVEPAWRTTRAAPDPITYVRVQCELNYSRIKSQTLHHFFSEILQHRIKYLQIHSLCEVFFNHPYFMSTSSLGMSYTLFISLLLAEIEFSIKRSKWYIQQRLNKQRFCPVVGTVKSYWSIFVLSLTELQFSSSIIDLIRLEFIVLLWIKSNF